jgi:hypothetical protein
MTAFGVRSGGATPRLSLALESLNAALEQTQVLAQLGLRVEPAAGVVEVHVAAVVEPRIAGAAKLIQQRRFGVSGVLAQERGFGHLRPAGF